MQIRLKRAYDEPSAQDGQRVLVDRLWPRGRRKEDLALDEWLKDIAPSTGLRQWFHQDAGRWDGFRERYAAELDGMPGVVERLRARAKAGRVTLVYGARDETRNHALVLKEYLEGKGSLG